MTKVACAYRLRGDQRIKESSEGQPGWTGATLKCTSSTQDHRYSNSAENVTMSAQWTSLLAPFHKHTHLYHTVLLSYTHIVPTLSVSSLPAWLSLWWVVGFRRRVYQPAWALCEHSHAYDSSMGQRTSVCMCPAVPALIRSSLGYVWLTHSARLLTLFCGKCWHGMAWATAMCVCVSCTYTLSIHTYTKYVFLHYMMLIMYLF